MKLQLQIRTDLKRGVALYRYLNSRRRIVSPVFDNYGKAEKWKKKHQSTES